MARVLLAATAVLLCGVALWFLLGDDPGARAPRTGAEHRSPSREQAPVRGVRERTRDQTDTGPMAEVYALIVDEDGAPVEHGTVTLECLASDGRLVALRGGIVPIGEDGLVRGPGCSGTVCAELRHVALTRAEPWVLEAGHERVLRARALRRLEGEVVDRDGTPIAGAIVSVVPLPGEEDPSALPPFTARTTSSDGEGVFAFVRVERPPCNPCREIASGCGEDQTELLVTYDEVMIVGRAPGYRLSESRVDVTGHDPGARLRLVLERPGPGLVGELRDAAGMAYPRASVFARSTMRPYELHRVAVADGTFAFDELGDGAYSLRAVQDGVELVVAEEVRAGDHIELTGTRPARGTDLHVEITDGGRPIAGLAVDGGPFSGATTDAEGVVVARQVAAHRYVLRISGPARQQSSHPVTVRANAPSQRFRIDLSASGSP